MSTALQEAGCAVGEQATADTLVKVLHDLKNSIDGKSNAANRAAALQTVESLAASLADAMQ